MVTGQDMQPDDLSGESYRGVPVPGRARQTSGVYGTGWRDGVDAALGGSGGILTTAARDTGDTGDQDAEDTTGAGDLSFVLSDEVNAFVLVTEDRTAEARAVVSGMSGRDRAVLSFWLEEMRDIVASLEMSRRQYR